jgi:transposase
MRVMHTDSFPESENLKTQTELLSEEIERLRLRNEYLESRTRILETKIEALLRRLYGRASEKIDPAQLKLFEKEFAEASSGVLSREVVDEDEADLEEAPKRQSRRNGRKPLPDDLRRERVYHEPDPAELVCPCCGGERERIGEEVTEELEYIPAQLFVLEHVRGKYACRRCHEGVAIADLPPRPIEKGRPGAGLLAHVVVSKYMDHLPLYRQEKIFGRQGVDLPRSTLCDWVGWVADLLSAIVKEMKRQLFERRLMQSDDTPVRVQDRDVKGKTRRGYLWSYGIPGAEVVFDFTMSRSRDGPQRFLAGYEGYLQADGYEGYNEALRVGKLTHIGCMAHVRRKFYAALEESPRHARAIIKVIRDLYWIEHELKESGADAAARVAVRQKRARPILDDLEQVFADLKDLVLPQSELGKAVSYARSQWPSIKRYTEVGEAEIDNNSCENSIRGVAVGRKNWLFCGHPNGGKRAAVLYSLVESCKRLGVEPFAYLKDVIDRVATHPASRIHELTPRGWKETHCPADQPA